MQSKVQEFEVIYQERKNVLKKTRKTDVIEELSELGKTFHRNVHRVNVLDPVQSAFRPGIPPVDLFPINTWKKLVNKFWQRVRVRELNYYPENGVESLRRTLCDYLKISRGLECDFEQIMIVGGSLQSLNLIGSIILDPGDKVVIENPSFPNIISLFSSLKADLIRPESDENGLKLNSISKDDFGGSKIIHLTPSCQYPMGMQMPLERRLEILKMAQKNRSIIGRERLRA